MDAVDRAGAGPFDYERAGLPGRSDVRRPGQTVADAAARRPASVARALHVGAELARSLRLVDDAQQRKRLVRDRVQSATQLRRQPRLAPRPSLQLKPKASNHGPFRTD